jgi:hypothetical protein
MTNNEFVTPSEHFQNQYSKRMSRDPYFEFGVSDPLAADQHLTEIGYHDEQRMLPRRVIGTLLARGGFVDSSVDQALEMIPGEKIDEMTGVIKLGLEKNNEVSREHQEKYESYLSEYAGVLSLAAENGLPVDPKLALRALAAAQVSIVSRETAKRHKFDAAYTIQSGRLLFLDSYGDPSLDRYVAYHELTHAVTGFHARRAGSESPDTTVAEVVHPGIRHAVPGGSVESPDSSHNSVEYIRAAFDEVVTDQISRILARAIESGKMPDFGVMTSAEFFDRTNQPDNGEARKQEWEVAKAIFERIPESERPIQKLLAMHFEYYDKRKPAGERSPARREFWQMANTFTNINTTDRIMREQGYEAAKTYVATDSYQKDLDTRRQKAGRLRPKLDSSGSISTEDIVSLLDRAEQKSTSSRARIRQHQSSSRFRESLSAMRSQNTDDFVTKTLDEMRARGLSDKQIKREIAKRWHPDTNGGDQRKSELLKHANDLMRRRRLYSARTPVDSETTVV